MKVNGKDYPIYEMENKTCLKPPTRCPYLHLMQTYSYHHFGHVYTYQGFLACEDPQIIQVMKPWNPWLWESSISKKTNIHFEDTTYLKIHVYVTVSSWFRPSPCLLRGIFYTLQLHPMAACRDQRWTETLEILGTRRARRMAMDGGFLKGQSTMDDGIFSG